MLHQSFRIYCVCGVKRGDIMSLAQPDEVILMLS